MILRRITEHVKAQNWFAVGLDFVIVVMGVFIGLQVQEWSGRQEDRRREMLIVADMLADLDIDRAQYAAGMSFDLRRISAANTSLAGAGLQPLEFDYRTQISKIVDYSFDVTATPDYPADQLGQLWTDLVIGFHPTPSTSTYDAMTGAGDIRIMRDREIVREIQLYHNGATSVQTQNEKMLSLRETLMDKGAQYGLAPYSKMRVEDYFGLIGSKPEFAANIRIFATFAIFHYGEIKSADAHAARLQDRLKNYLEAAK